MKVKYKQSLLGPIWLVFQPVALLVAFVVGFSKAAHIETEGVPYALFALTGLSVWSYFAAATSAGALSLIGNTNLVRFTACPRLVLTIASLLASSPALAVPVVAAVVAALATGYLSVNILLAPVVIVWLFVLTAAVTAILASVSVRYRDVQAALPFLLQAGVFLTPVAYPITQLSAPLKAILSVNPLTGVLEVWRWAILGLPVASMSVLVSLVVTVVLLVGGWRVFGRLEVTMTDDI
jgi:ABC-type polysaccharide/polyol phosphate export permease